MNSEPLLPAFTSLYKTDTKAGTKTSYHLFLLEGPAHQRNLYENIHIPIMKRSLDTVYYKKLFHSLLMLVCFPFTETEKFRFKMSNSYK